MLGRARRTRGCPRLRALVHRLEGGDGLTESELEDAVIEVLEMAELPMPEKQRTVIVGGRLRRVDFRFKDQFVIIEADSRAYHSDDKSFEDDRDRRNKLTAQGYVVLQWTWEAIHERPEELLVELCTLLSSR
jgi:very-short-patch-repair endonuclease